jgi:hypothetical protein
VHIKRNDPDYYSSLRSGPGELDALFRTQQAAHKLPILLLPGTEHSQADCSAVEQGMDDKTHQVYGLRSLAVSRPHPLHQFLNVPWLHCHVWAPLHPVATRVVYTPARLTLLSELRHRKHLAPLSTSQFIRRISPEPPSSATSSPRTGLRR